MKNHPLNVGLSHIREAGTQPGESLASDSLGLHADSTYFHDLSPRAFHLLEGRLSPKEN